MQEPGVISEYVDLLAGDLNFDRALSRRVREEVKDHLWQAVTADPTDNRLKAEQHAVANFGDAHVIAAQFAVVSLARHTRRAGVAAILMIAGVFVAMKTRVAWFGVTQSAMCDDMQAVSAIVGLIDRHAFWLSVVIGLGGLAYISSCRTPSTLHPAYCKRLRRFFLLCTAAAATLVVSVASDGVLTVLRLEGAELSVDFVVPIVSMAIEIACIGALVLQIREIMRRAAFTATFSRT